FLPLDRSDWDIVRRISPGIDNWVTSQVSFPPTSASLGNLDAEFKKLTGRTPTQNAPIVQTLEALRVSLRILEEHAGWQAGGQVTRGESYRQDLDHWLQLRALDDLTRKHYHVANTLLMATKRGWEPAPDDLLRATEDDAFLGKWSITLIRNPLCRPCR